MQSSKYRPGDLVVYRKQKLSAHPGPRAREVDPSPRGETYSYCVDKFWMVVDSLGDQVVVTTRRGKRHLLDATNRRLRRAGWWEMLFYRHRFPETELRQLAPGSPAS